VLDSGHTVEEIAAAVQQVQDGRAEAERTGRADIVAYVRTAFGPGARERVARVIGERPDAAHRALAGSIADVAEGVARFHAAGVDDVVLLPTDDEDLHPFLAAVGQVAAAGRGAVS